MLACSMFISVPALQDEKTVELKDENLMGKLDPKEFFMSETFADVVVECEGETFPAHRIVLAGNFELFALLCLVGFDGTFCIHATGILIS